MRKLNILPHPVHDIHRNDDLRRAYIANIDSDISPNMSAENDAPVNVSYRGVRHRNAISGVQNTQENIFYLPWWDFYFKAQEVAEAYLDPGYDHLFYIARGGMSVVHRLAHILGIPSGGQRMSPLSIQRHASDSIQARSIPPRLLEPIRPELVTGKRVLLVEDTIGQGATLQCALTELQQHHPAAVDIVIAGLDHADFSRWASPDLRETISEMVVCFDYWGWMVLPWEMQAADAFQMAAAASKVPYSQMTALERRRAWQACGGYSANNRHYDARWLQRFIPIIQDMIHPASAIIELCPGATVPWLDTQLGAQFDASIDYLPMARESHLGLFSCPRSSADMIVARNVLPSQMGIHGWQTLLESVKYALKPGGHFIFDYLDRAGIKRRQDVRTTRDYYTPPLLDRLMQRCGFAPTKILYAPPPSASLVNFSCFERV